MKLDTENLITVYQACDLLNKTYRTIALLKAKQEGQPQKGMITWYLVGGLTMLDKTTLFAVATKKRWIVSKDSKIAKKKCVDCGDEFDVNTLGRPRVRCDKCSSRKTSRDSYRNVNDVKPENYKET